MGIHYCMGGLQTTVDGECIKGGKALPGCMWLVRQLAACMETTALGAIRSLIAWFSVALLVARHQSMWLVPTASSVCIRLTPRTSRSQRSSFSDELEITRGSCAYTHPFSR